jgi:hypothetical protein
LYSIPWIVEIPAIVDTPAGDVRYAAVARPVIVDCPEIVDGSGADRP